MEKEINETAEVNEIFNNAEKLAMELRNDKLMEDHFLVALLEKYNPESSEKVEDKSLLQIITKSGISKRDIRKQKTYLSLLPCDYSTSPDYEYEDYFYNNLKNLAKSLKYNKIDSSILILGLIKEQGISKEFFESKGITESKILSESKFETIMEQHQDSFFGFPPEKDEEEDVEYEKSSREEEGELSTLKNHSVCMNSLAEQGKYDPVFGRDKEIERLMEILCCRKKNNGVLLGDPGVGKSTIIEELAQRIVKGQVPKYLLDKKIYSLDLNSLVSGTKYRGDYEERLGRLIKEVTSHPDIIIYIDELHNLVGSGSSSGNGDASNVLKPYLARGEFQCIGSTTINEYRKFIEKDGALKRRFQEVIVCEPDKKETIEILKSIREKYQEFHGVSYDDESIEVCVKLADRYISDRNFPDKAIDVLDSAGSKLKLTRPSNVKKIEALKKKAEKLIEQKKKAVLSQDFSEAQKIREQEIQVAEELVKEKSLKDTDYLKMTSAMIEKTVSQMTDIPVERLGKSDLEKLRGIKSILEGKIIGQEEAISEVLGSLQRNSLGLRDMKKPIASFLLVGPTGVGKTYLCKTLAQEFFGSSDSLIRIDCNTLIDRASVSSLTGSTPGYVGYDEPTVFDKVKRRPFSLVLFDEIEKASSEIKQSLLSILDEGYLTLGNGTKVDFKNTIICFTSNAGTKSLQLHGNGIGFSKDSDSKKTAKKIVMKEISNLFSPEFINRLSGIINFNSLGDTELLKICDLEIQKFYERLSERGYTSINVLDTVKTKIISECKNKGGAREMQRAINKFIVDPIANKILESGDSKRKNIKISLDTDESVKVTFCS